MALNDDDKKYVKKTVDDSLDNKFKEMEKSAFKNATNPNEHKNKYVEKLKKEDQEKEDLHELLLELRERDKKGQNTIAQKVEMLNLTMKEAIPDDFRDAVKETGANIKKGASQSLRGLESLTGRVMNTNPLTAFLWANRGIVGDVWNIGAGAVNAGLGAVKGVAKGAAGLVNASINMFKKKKSKKQEKEEESTTSETILNEETSNELEKEEDYDQSTAKKIDELHALFFKGDLFGKKDKEEKEKQNILQKGLSGLGKGMKAVNAIIETIAAKQKMILSGLMLGAVGILALVGWFKSDNFKNFISTAVKTAIKDLPNKIKELLDGGKDLVNKGLDYADSFDLNAGGVQDANTQEDNMLKALSTQSFNGVKAITDANKDLKQGSTTKMLSQQDFKADDLNKDFQDKNKLSDSAMRMLQFNDKVRDGFKTNIKQFSSTGNIRLAFPVKIKVIDMEFNKEAGASTGTILIQKAQVTSRSDVIHKDQGYLFGKNVATDLNIGTLPKLMITNVINLLVALDYVVPAKTPFCTVTGDYQIIGDLAAFMQGEDYGEFTNKNMGEDFSRQNMAFVEASQSKDFGKNKQKTFDTFNKRLAVNKAVQDYANHPINGARESIDIVKKGLEDKGIIDSTVTEEPQKIPTPPKQVDQGSNAEDKMKQQDNVRKEVEAKKIEDNQNQQLSQGKENNKVASLSIAPKAKDNDQYPDMMFIGQFNASNNNYLQTC